MSVNKYRPHVVLIPEDDANRQLANGFLLHPAVNISAVDLRSPAGGWGNALKVFEEVYVKYLRRYKDAHVVMLIDFDGVETRRESCEQRVPEDVKSRVFVIGSKDDPEAVRRDRKETLETIGRSLADECSAGKYSLWVGPHIGHNNEEVRRLKPVVKPILFQDVIGGDSGSSTLPQAPAP